MKLPETKYLAVLAVFGLAGAVGLTLHVRALTGEPHPDMLVNCRGGEGGQIVSIADTDCMAIAQALAGDVKANRPQATTGPVNNKGAALGATADAAAQLKPLPQDIAQRVPTFAQHLYYIEGNDVALVEPQSRRVVVKIDILHANKP